MVRILARAAAIVSTVVAAGLLAGCAGMPTEGPPAPAPVYRVGDKWDYNGTDGFRTQTTWIETHEITAIDAAGIHVKVTLRGATVDVQRAELWEAPGLVKVGAAMDIETRRFTTPFERYRFPLTPGETWNQRPTNFNETSQETGQLSNFRRVEGWTTVTTPAGTFDVQQIRVIMRLDDSTFWRGETNCDYLILYAPKVGAAVREEKNAYYLMRGDGMQNMVRAQNTVLELVSFTPGT